MKPILSLLVGVSGSGKSTYGNGLKTSLSATTVCPDEIRAEVFGDAANQSDPQRIFSIAFRRADDLLSQGKNVVIDATNLTRRARKDWIKIGKKYGAELRAYVLTPSTEIAKKQNQSRDRVVPDHVIDAQAQRYQAPVDSEGFDKITFV